MRALHYRANSPGRKNIRRTAALARMADKPGKSTRSQADHDAERARLQASILPQAQADAIRTKKDRSARGRLTRNG